MKKYLDLLEWILILLSCFISVFVSTWTMLKVMDVLIQYNVVDYVSGLILVLTWVSVLVAVFYTSMQIWVGVVGIFRKKSVDKDMDKYFK